MNINSVTHVINPKNFGTGIKRRLFNFVPNILVKDSPKLNDFGNFINRPDVNRGIMGITALLTQPYIDRHNPRVDEQTATTSMFRTIGKIVAGTTVGCAVRSACFYLTNACTSANPNASKWKKFLMPTERMQRLASSHNMDWFKSYKNLLATALGLTAMLATNVLLDVPFTSYISKKLMDIRQSHQDNKEGKV